MKAQYINRKKGVVIRECALTKSKKRDYPNWIIPNQKIKFKITINLQPLTTVDRIGIILACTQ